MDSQTYERMYGICANTKFLRTFKTSARKVKDELSREGFHDAEIDEFLSDLIFG